MGGEGEDNVLFKCTEFNSIQIIPMWMPYKYLIIDYGFKWDEAGTHSLTHTHTQTNA